MRRVISFLAVALIAATAAVLAPAPASAHDAVCAGQGLATTGAGLLYPLVGSSTSGTGTVTVNLAPTTTTFAFGFTLGDCVPLGSKPGGLTASGTVSGWCGLSSGHGDTDNNPAVTGPHPFAWVGVGSSLVITGELVGVVNASPNVLNNESCTAAGGADEFLVSGAVALRHCATTGSLLNTTTITSFQNLVAPGTHTTITGGNWDTHHQCA